MLFAVIEDLLWIPWISILYFCTQRNHKKLSFRGVTPSSYSWFSKPRVMRWRFAFRSVFNRAHLHKSTLEFVGGGEGTTQKSCKRRFWTYKAPLADLGSAISKRFSRKRRKEDKATPTKKAYQCLRLNKNTSRWLWVSWQITYLWLTCFTCL